MGPLSELSGSRSKERPMRVSSGIQSELLPSPRPRHRNAATSTEIADESRMARPQRGAGRFTDEPVPALFPMGRHPS